MLSDGAGIDDVDQEYVGCRGMGREEALNLRDLVGGGPEGGDQVGVDARGAGEVVEGVRAKLSAGFEVEAEDGDFEVGGRRPSESGEEQCGEYEANRVQSHCLMRFYHWY